MLELKKLDISCNNITKIKGLLPPRLKKLNIDNTTKITEMEIEELSEEIKIVSVNDLQRELESLYRI